MSGAGLTAWADSVWGAEKNPGRVVLLNGPPSSGKTTLALALQAALPDPYFHRSLDDFRAGYSTARWTSDDGTLFERVMVGYLGAVRAMAVAGNNIIAEAVITPARRRLYIANFDHLAVTLVGVRCPLELAIARERQRTDRLRGPVELPPDAYAAIHSHGSYDIDVDTSTGTARELATELAIRLRAVKPSALEAWRRSA